MGFYIVHPVYSASYNLISLGIWKSKKTYISSICIIISSIVNILLTMNLVKFFGLIGVAFATSISSLFWIYITMIFSEKLYKTGIINREILIDKFKLIITLMIMTLTYQNIQSNVFQYLILISIILLFSFMTWKSKKEIFLKLINDL